jgi:hypothetical protein
MSNPKHWKDDEDISLWHKETKTKLTIKARKRFSEKHSTKPLKDRPSHWTKDPEIYARYKKGKKKITMKARNLFNLKYRLEMAQKSDRKRVRK